MVGSENDLAPASADGPPVDKRAETVDGQRLAARAQQDSDLSRVPGLADNPWFRMPRWRGPVPPTRKQLTYWTIAQGPLHTLDAPARDRPRRRSYANRQLECAAWSGRR